MLPDIHYYLSQGRYLIHTYIVRKELVTVKLHNAGSVTFVCYGWIAPKAQKK